MLKMLYWAEREAITTWYRSITGDEIFSMPQGMVLSRIYNLARYKVSGSERDAWKAVFTPRYGNAIGFQPGASFDRDPLSEREEQALARAFDKIRELMAMHGEKYIEVLHQMFPEWVNPNGSSVLVTPKELLLLHGEDDDTISEIAADLDAVNSAKLALQA